MAIKENTYVYVNISEEGVEFKRSRCIKIHENGTCDVKIMMKGNSYQKDENGKPVITNMSIDLVEENKPGANTEMKKEKPKKQIKENSEGKKIIFEEVEEDIDEGYNSKHYWSYNQHDDFLTEEDVEKLGTVVFRMTKPQIEKARINY